MIRTFQSSAISQESADSKSAAPYAGKGRGMYESLSMSSVGLEMGLCVIIGLLVGRWADEKLGTSEPVPWMLMLGLAIGFAAGIKGVMRAVRKADNIATRNERVAAGELARQQATASTRTSLQMSGHMAQDVANERIEGVTHGT
jgi:F0F1-type ATP synthase assembly protein I